MFWEVWLLRWSHSQQRIKDALGVLPAKHSFLGSRFSCLVGINELWFCAICGEFYSSLELLVIAQLKYTTLGDGEGSNIFTPIFASVSGILERDLNGWSSENIKVLYGPCCSDIGRIQSHFFHLVDRSPWPVFSSFGVLYLATGGVMYMHSFKQGWFLFLSGGVVLASVAFFWWGDIICEGTGGGFHTLEVQRGLRLGMILFIVSEVMFFVVFFWAFFHSSLSPVVEIGAEWPPWGITPMDVWGVPFLNTLLLLLSGVFVTSVHCVILEGSEEVLGFGVVGGNLLFSDLYEVEKSSGRKLAFSFLVFDFYQALEEALNVPLVDGSGLNPEVSYWVENNPILCDFCPNISSFGFVVSVGVRVLYWSHYLFGSWIGFGFACIVDFVYAPWSGFLSFSVVVKKNFINLGYHLRQTLFWVIYKVFGLKVYQRVCLLNRNVYGFWLAGKGLWWCVKSYVIASPELEVLSFSLALSAFFKGLCWELAFIQVSLESFMNLSSGDRSIHIWVQIQSWWLCLRTLWLGHRGGLSQSNRISNGEVIGGNCKHIRVQETDIWAVNWASYKAFLRVFYGASESKDSVDNSNSQRNEVEAKSSSIKYRFAVCGACTDRMRCCLVDKTWADYQPSNFCIWVYCVVFFILSSWEGYGVWTTREVSSSGVWGAAGKEWEESMNFSSVSDSGLQLLGVSGVSRFCYILGEMKGTAVLGVLWSLRWDFLFCTVLERILLWDWSWVVVRGNATLDPHYYAGKGYLGECGSPERTFSEGSEGNVESFCFVIYMFLITLGLAFLFLCFQFVEYSDAYFGISDGIYGSTFYMATGFHGFHVLVGLSFLVVGFGRFASCHFSPVHHVGLEAAIWYWHFVDVVWIYLFFSIYWWGNGSLGF